jgi:hypothetical protein
MLLVAIAVTMLVSCGVSLWKTINGNYDEVVRLFAKHPKIADAKIWPIREGFAELVTDAYGVEFTLVGKPDSVIALSTPTVDLFQDTSSIPLDRIGDVLLCARYIDDQSGSTSHSSVDIGAQSKLDNALPLAVRNIDELINRYDELLSHFRNWPDSSNVGVVRLSPTRRIEYWAETAGSN